MKELAAAAAAAGEKKPHVLVFPYPAQGHINPALSLAKCLASKGLRITLITTTRVRRSATVSMSAWDSMISIVDIGDGSDEAEESDTMDKNLKHLQAALSKNLTEFLDSSRCSAAKAIVYDSTMPWILDIAHARGLRAASLFTQNCAVCAVYYHIQQGSLKYPYDQEDGGGEDCVVSLPSLPPLNAKKDLPYFDAFSDPKHSLMRLLAEQFLNLEKVDWILFNTFYKLETRIVDWMASQWPAIKTVGPMCSLLQSDKKYLSNDSSMISLFEPRQDACAEWLNSKEASSVVYVSFGSLAQLNKEQMEEVALGLLTSDCFFLWVVRASERNKLPKNFVDAAVGKGLIVEWCHQPQVLANDAVACFMTHCGWNSTLEALVHGVPLIAMAQWVDQTTNAKLIEDLWGVGTRVKAREDGIVAREEIRRCVECMIRGDRAKEMKRNAAKWQELAKEAVDEGGTSATNIEAFVSELKNN
ncbi:UDP glycosyltransferase 9-like [Andrographis paniculata]|uniref:Glycosyltransferase n=1 Tax=Andrographis paniculata TaxID=175694 RepID=A0A8T8BE27_ANDPA|nr:UDP glycosyltransferase 9-like [Andrographis paniculata]QDA11329.1 UDP-glycosyltransferase 74E [Andrographis paniculata]